MRALSTSLRKQLETSVLAARRAAEGASRAAIEGLGVFADRRPEHLDAGQASLRNGLRAKWRQLGGGRELLVAECAYEQWHRLLFARFLAENGLLLHPEYKAPVTLADCEELAAELAEPDAWSVAARFAAEILPGIFRLDDPCARLRLAPEGRDGLEQILEALPPETFAAEDALGWVYQFWQKDKKDEVNASERKISGAELGPVTQLFTENYMVRFLLENSVGAWWASRHPDSPLISTFDYLRFDGDGHPATGGFDGWPEHVAEITVMDPCCGSGHFLVEAFSMLWRMRAEEEGLAAIDAQDAVLRENLFGLELDPRCVQIAMFAVALQAWKSQGGWRRLPVPNIACSGLSVRATAEEWEDLAQGDERLQKALRRLHTLFRDAHTLGSLIEPRIAADGRSSSDPQRTLDDVDLAGLTQSLDRVSRGEVPDPAEAVLGEAAIAVAKSANLLAGAYTLVTTNVPYLLATKQDAILSDYCERALPKGTKDLATAFLLRLASLTESGGSHAFVSPQSWLTLGTYEMFRREVLRSSRLDCIARLGTGAFSAISGAVVNICLGIISERQPTSSDLYVGLDCQEAKGATAKADALRDMPLAFVRQSLQLERPLARILTEDQQAAGLLGEHVETYQGICLGDSARFRQAFWEGPLTAGWELQQNSVPEDIPYGGRQFRMLWENGEGQFMDFVIARLGADRVGTWIRGLDAWRKRGIAVSNTGAMRSTLYSGEPFQHNLAVLIPKNEDELSAIWCYAASEEFKREVRAIDSALKVENTVFRQIPFDLDRWQRVARDTFPDGLPEPASDDPTQWLFKGRPNESTSPLHVAVARLVGYRWPHQADSDDLDSYSDTDGIVCLPAVAGEATAADRVQQLLAAAFGNAWTPANVQVLLERVGSRRKTLREWLRDEFFKQHCALFENRPFVWHVWDGQRDGFSALVDYHRLNRKTLEKLTYTYLGQDWAERQRGEAREGVTGAEERLSAALHLQQKLEAILEGEAPFDIFVRWKEPHEQPIGWEPDLNDGVRLNIRPFVEAGVLRAPFNIHWRKDRGKNPDGTERENDTHLALAEKDEARRRAGRL